MTIHPGNLLKSGCDPDLIGVGDLHMCAPHIFLGLPLPPCPYGHGWDAVDNNKIKQNGVCAARRVSGEDRDEFLAGVSLLCCMCEEEKGDLWDQYAIAEMELFTDDAAEYWAAWKKKQCYYRSYNPESLRLYAERFPWWVQGLPFVVTNKRTALTRSLSRRIIRACSTKSNPNDLANELAERKAAASPP